MTDQDDTPADSQKTAGEPVDSTRVPASPASVLPASVPASPVVLPELQDCPPQYLREPGSDDAPCLPAADPDASVPDGFAVFMDEQAPSLPEAPPTAAGVAPEVADPSMPTAATAPDDAGANASLSEKAKAETAATPSASGPAPQPGGVPGFGARPPSGFAGPAIINMIAHLRNTRAGESYETRLEVEGLTEVVLESDTGSGLTYDPDGRIWGTPAAAGDFTLNFIGKLNGMRCHLAAHLAVIPDPKTLWKSLPSDRSAPYWKPDQDFGRTEADLLCLAASVRGRSHARDGGFRDDDFCVLADSRSGWHIAAVADGAGSAKYSRQGSQIATETVADQLPALLETIVTPGLEALIDPLVQGHPEAVAQVKAQLLYTSLATVAFNAIKAIETEAIRRGEPASAYSTTLVIGVAKKLREDLWFIASFAIGDGGIAVFDAKSDDLRVLSLADSGEYAGQTRFLQKSEFASYAGIEPRMIFTLVRDFSAVVLMTDGITDPKFPTDAAFANPARWAEFWRDDLTKEVDLSRHNSELKKQLLEWLEFWSPGNHDDRTIALMLP